MESYSGERQATAVHEEERCTAHDLSKISTNLQRIFGDEVGSKEWKVDKGDPFKLTRYATGESDVFIASLRHNKTPDALKAVMGVDERVETNYVFENDGTTTRLACFVNNMVEENGVSAEIMAVFDRQDQLSEEEFDGLLAAGMERLRELKRGQEKMMIAALRTRTESTASYKQAKHLNDLLRTH